MLEKFGNFGSMKQPRDYADHVEIAPVHTLSLLSIVCAVRKRGTLPGGKANQAAKPRQAKPAWLRAHASWRPFHGNYKSECGRGARAANEVWLEALPSPEMFCPSNISISTNMLWSLVSFWAVASCKWLGLGTIPSLSVLSAADAETACGTME